MEDQTSVNPHKANFLQCNEMVDLTDLVVIRLPGKYTSQKYTFEEYTSGKYTSYG